MEGATSKEKSFLISNSGVGSGQGGAGLERSCAVPRFSLGGPPGKGQVGVVLREEGAGRECCKGTGAAGGSGFEEGTLPSGKSRGNC